MRGGKGGTGIRFVGVNFQWCSAALIVTGRPRDGGVGAGEGLGGKGGVCTGFTVRELSVRVR